MKFKNKVRIICIAIATIPLILSYVFFTNLMLKSIEDNIESDLKETAFVVSNTPLVQEKLKDEDNDRSIQDYVKEYIENFRNVDIIVVGDMKGIKYSHLDQAQVGERYKNPDNQKVINTGESYFSTMEGSVGITYRYFKPIYLDGKQVGFVMVGKYLSDMEKMNTKTIFSYGGILLIVILITIILAEYFARKVKESILGLEPEEISRLYREKRIILDTISNPVIAIDKNNKVIEKNIECIKKYSDLEVNDLVLKLKESIKEKKSFKMKEFIIKDEKVFVNLSFIEDSGKYFGAVISIMNRDNISKVAREITGVDEMLKNIRANIHEFKNKLHVILGLINVEEYDEAKKYINQCQTEVDAKKLNVSNVKDNLLSAMLLSKKLIAKEKDIKFEINKKTSVLKEHGRITSTDIVIILGNLIENAYDSFDLEIKKDKYVLVYINENSEKIEIQLKDNGKKIDPLIREYIFESGVSSKGKGRGIGLSTLKGRVELYDGDIDIIEEKDYKIFKVTLKK